MYVTKRQSGLGDFDPSFISGALTVAFVLGLSLIVWNKVSPPSRSSSGTGKVWASGAYRSPESASWYADTAKAHARRRR